MANDYSDLAKRLLQEGGDFHRACSDAIHSLALENKATHQAWKADIKACEAEVKQWKSGCEKEHTRAQALTAEVAALKAKIMDQHEAISALQGRAVKAEAQAAEYKAEIERLKRQIEAQAILARDGDSRAVIRYAALTEAAEACRKKLHNGQSGYFDQAVYACIAAIEALRYKT